MEYLKNAIYGLLIGVANAIPGVSGGTMAVILDVYDDIMNSISRANIKKSLRLLIPLGIGAVGGIFALSNVIVAAMETYPAILDSCFIGLIIGSMPALYKKTRGEDATSVKTRNWVFFALALALMIGMCLVNKDAIANKTLAEMGGVSLGLMIRLFLSSAICMVAMMLPGLSGSLIMLLLGVYGVVMEAIATVNLLVLCPVFLGVAAGGLLGVVVIKRMLRSHPQVLYCAILGLMVGSIFVIWPHFGGTFDMVASAIGFVCFTLAAYFLSSRK